MSRYLLGRLIQAVPTVLLVSILVFLMLYLIAGDPAGVFLGEHRSTPELLAKVREDMGLNRPMRVQYLDYMWKATHGDLGTSLNSNRPVMGEILTRLPSTLELALSAMVISMVLGFGLGILAAIRHNTIVDTGALFIALIGISM